MNITINNFDNINVKDNNVQFEMEVYLMDYSFLKC